MICISDLMAEMAEAGALAVEVLESCEWVDHAPTMHAAVIKALDDRGFFVEPEFPCDYYRNGRLNHGRIDIVATLRCGAVAIELDCRKPRLKSIQKLRKFDGVRIIGTRGVRCEVPEGIHAVVCMPVRQPTNAELQDKRIYREAAL